MLICRSFDELRSISKPIHWAIGFFDGVHKGHVRVMHSADTPGALRGVITFEQHPLALFNPTQQPLLITPCPEYKAELISTLGGADVLLRLPFNVELASLSPVQFLDSLESACCVAGISVGENWRFGRGGTGDSSLLSREGERRGWRICISPLEQLHGSPVSSRRIRATLAAGHMQDVADLLGHSFAIAGIVEHGQHLARRLGFPTANISIRPHSALPPAGVYAISCLIDNTLHHGIANLGLRPSIVEQRKLPRLEAHFPGFQGDLYRRQLRVCLSRFIRPEQEFNSLEALRRQVFADIASLPLL